MGAYKAIFSWGMPGTANCRDDFDVLVLDGGYKQSVRTTQSLGRAGLRVAVGDSAGQYDPRLPIPAFCSRYCAHSVIFPSFRDDSAAFADAVVDFVCANPTRVVLPTGDGTIAALSSRREQLRAAGAVLALASDAALEVANDKDRTLEVAGKLGIACPRTIRIESVADLTTAAAELGFPIVLKPTASWAGQAAGRLTPVEVVNEDEAAGKTRNFLAVGAHILAQEYAGGRREEVTLLIVNGDVLVETGHVELRTVPQLGGASVIRQSIELPPDIRDASIQLAKAIGLEGTCGVEFRRAPDGRALLMEINARLGGALESALRSGIDLPLLVWQWAAGIPVARPEGGRTGVRTRWLQGDLRWLRENARRQGRPDSVPLLRSLGIFIGEFGRTRYYDYFDWRDVKPGMAELRLSLDTAIRFVRRA